MSFIGRNGFFGALTPYSGAYHPSVYRKYSRGGGSVNGTGTLGKAFAYTRPRFSGGGEAGAGDPYDSDIQNIEASTQSQQPRQPGLQERVFKFMANKDHCASCAVSAETLKGLPA